jgi:hypothetical protein
MWVEDNLLSPSPNPTLAYTIGLSLLMATYPRVPLPCLSPVLTLPREDPELGEYRYCNAVFRSDFPFWCAASPTG